MSAPCLAVFATGFGASFIDRHLTDLMPGHTIAVGSYSSIPAFASLWPVTCPMFVVDRWGQSLAVRLAARTGMSRTRLRDAAVSRFLTRHRTSVVLGEYLDLFLDFVPLIERLALPYVVQGHGIDVSAALRDPALADRFRAYRSAAAILTRCEPHRQRLIHLGLPAERVHVNHGGVDVPATPPRRPEDARHRLLAIGVMVPKKGPIYLLEAFRLAAREDARLTLDFVGGGPLFAAAQQFVTATGLTGRVRLHGIASEETKQRLLRECGVFVQHSLVNPETGDEEGLPAAIQEAMAQGMAVVSTRHAGIPEAVVEEATGYLVEEGDVATMATAILRVPEVATEFGAAGHRRAAERFTWAGERARLLGHLTQA